MSILSFLNNPPLVFGQTIIDAYREGSSARVAAAVVAAAISVAVVKQAGPTKAIKQFGPIPAAPGGFVLGWFIWNLFFERSERPGYIGTSTPKAVWAFYTNGPDNDLMFALAMLALFVSIIMLWLGSIPVKFGGLGVLIGTPVILLTVYDVWKTIEAWSIWSM